MIEISVEKYQSDSSDIVCATVDDFLKKEYTDSNNSLAYSYLTAYKKLNNNNIKDIVKCILGFVTESCSSGFIGMDDYTKNFCCLCKSNNCQNNWHFYMSGKYNNWLSMFCSVDCAIKQLKKVYGQSDENDKNHAKILYLVFLEKYNYRTKYYIEQLEFIKLSDEDAKDLSNDQYYKDLISY